MTSQILTIRRILEGIRTKNLQATLLFVDFTKAFDSIHREKLEQILLAYSPLANAPAQPYCIVWDELPRALVSMTTHTKRNICALITQATFPH